MGTALHLSSAFVALVARAESAVGGGSEPGAAVGHGRSRHQFAGKLTTPPQRRFRSLWFVFTRDGVLYRQIGESARRHYEQLIGQACTTGSSGDLVPHEEVSASVSPDGRAFAVTRPERVGFSETFLCAPCADRESVREADSLAKPLIAHGEQWILTPRCRGSSVPAQDGYAAAQENSKSRWLRAPATSFVSRAGLLPKPPRAATRAGRGVRLGGGNRQIDLRADADLAPHVQAAADELGALAHAGQAEVSAPLRRPAPPRSMPCPSSLHLQPELPVVVRDLHLDPARVRVAEARCAALRRQSGRCRRGGSDADPAACPARRHGRRCRFR